MKNINELKNNKCQICQKQALFLCGKCQNVQYCSKQHQITHWKNQHKQLCKLISKANGNAISLESMTKKIYDIRKSYFDNYSNKAYQLCLIDAKVLIDLQRKHMTIRKDFFGEFDYGAAICLLVKTQLLLGDKRTAQIQLTTYLTEKKQFLYNMDEVISVKKQIKEYNRDYLQRKLNLISTVANLSYAIGINCLVYYVLYTKYIEKAFGVQSFEASNCYFLIGCYFVQEGYFNKAIACFERSAKLRGMYAGDCYFNIGVLYKLQNNLSKSLQMFQLALKSREEQYGQDSSQIAQVNENMGIIYVQLNDFKTAMMEYQKAFRIRSNDPISAEYGNLIELIQELYAKLVLYIDSGQPDLKKPQIFTHLKLVIQQQKLYWTDMKQKKANDSAQTKKKMNASQILDSKSQSKSQNQIKQQSQKQIVIAQPKTVAEALFKLPQTFLLNLNPSQLFRLSQLQVQLENCLSQFAVVYSVASSPFFKSLSKQRLVELAAANQRLFELISLEQIETRQ